MSGLPTPFDLDPDFLEDLGIAPQFANVEPTFPAPQRAGWRIERWTPAGSTGPYDWVALPPFPFKRLDDAIRLLQPGDRIVNVVTGRVVIES